MGKYFFQINFKIDLTIDFICCYNEYIPNGKELIQMYIADSIRIGTKHTIDTFAVTFFDGEVVGVYTEDTEAAAHAKSFIKRGYKRDIISCKRVPHAALREIVSTQLEESLTDINVSADYINRLAWFLA